LKSKEREHAREREREIEPEIETTDRVRVDGEIERRRSRWSATVRETTEQMEREQMERGTER
jgi:hypothetical protein